MLEQTQHVFHQIPFYTFISALPRNHRVGIVGVGWTSYIFTLSGLFGMRFHLVDRIDAHEPGKFLRGCKFLALGEEYLADHFPRFPVMPGVLMLQALSEAAAWLWRASSGYQHSVIVLREVKNVKYGSFMLPGRRMDIAVDWYKQDGDFVTFRGKGADDAGQQTVSAQFVLHGYNLSDRGPAGVNADEQIRTHLKARWALLTGELRT